MATIATYSDLRQQIQAVIEDDGVETIAYIPLAIDLAEERLFKELELPDLEQKTTGSLTTNNNLIAKPSRFKYMSHFTITAGGQVYLLEQRTEDYLLDYWPNSVLVDQPVYYCNASATEFKLAPTPGQNYFYEMKFHQIPEKLSVLNTTNYFLENCLDSLYFAALVEMAKFLKAWSQVQIWDADFQKARDSWNLNRSRQLRDNGATPNNPESGINSLKSAVNSQA